MRDTNGVLRLHQLTIQTGATTSPAQARRLQYAALSLAV